ncbi:response regulator [Sulfurimonas sp.]|uniref:response regulator n=1 Tax=Sulfurimonas sp. TaxID=2022749 RepID=UPI002628FE6F|nr:response regulator [Sulfurimonas sp.]
MKNVVIIEDESIVAMEIAGFVKGLGYKVVATFSNAAACLALLKKEVVDLILIDVYIEGDMDGIACAAAIQSWQNIPIIYISAFSDDETLERAIKTKPSAYLVKPFNREELRAAMKIALSHAQEHQKRGDVIFDEEFSFDTKSDELLHNAQSVHLTKKELELLKLFLGAKNSVLSLYEIENEIWPDKESNENTRRALISRLRAKLNYKFIETIHSIGYKLHI